MMMNITEEKQIESFGDQLLNNIDSCIKNGGGKFKWEDKDIMVVIDKNGIAWFNLTSVCGQILGYHKTSVSSTIKKFIFSDYLKEWSELKPLLKFVDMTNSVDSAGIHGKSNWGVYFLL